MDVAGLRLLQMCLPALIVNVGSTLLVLTSLMKICFKNLSVLLCYPYLYIFVSLVRRWMVLHPEQAHLLKEAKKKQRSQLSRNFVDRESERPALAVNGLIPLQMVVPPSDVGAENLRKKRKRKSRYILFKLLFHFPIDC